MQTTSRQAYLDWLRIMAILGVLFFHSAMPYASEMEWHIKNKETSNLLLEFNFWLSRFRMPLLFFISGTVSYFMLKNKSTASFIGLRFRRLFLPLLFGMLVIVPPQVYMERLTQGFHGNFFDFYPSIFQTGAYPKGNLSWHHLWFIFYLFVYDIIFAPLFKYTISTKGLLMLQRLNFLAKGKMIYLLTLPGVIIYTGLCLRFPTTNDFIHDWCAIFYWLQFLLVGFICIANPEFMNSLERNRRTSFALAFTTFLFINYIRWNSMEPWNVISNYRSDWRTYGFLSLYAFTAWFWVMTAIGYGKKYLDRKIKALNYINQAVYPFYILHQTVIVVLTYYVVQVNESIFSKYIFTVVLTFIISMSLYHLFIRPFAITRLLFGVKPEKKKDKTDTKPAIDVIPVHTIPATA